MIGICHCCGYTTRLKEYTGPRTQRCLAGEGKSRFCLICASTFLSYAITYPELYGEDRHLFSSIGWIANEIIRTLEVLLVVVAIIGLSIMALVCFGLASIRFHVA